MLNYTVAFQSNTGNWLFVAPQSGTTAANSLLSVNVIPTGLTAGQYTGSITITATGPGGAVVADSPVTIPVTLNVTSVSLTLSSTDLTFQQVLGGPAPASQTVNIGSSGQTLLAYSAVANSNNAVNWLAVSPASGNTSANGTLTVSVDGSKLTPGTTYNGTIVITSPGAGNSPATINVHLKVDPGSLSAPTTTLTFTQLAGGTAPAAQTIAVTGSPAALNFTVTSSTQNGVNWLGASPASGATPSNVQVTVNGGSLAVGQYTGTVTIASAGAAGSPIAVPVVLNVVAPGTLTATPTTLAFTYTIGQTAPVAQNLALSSTAAASFTTQVQVDGAGTWLTVTPASGNSPATLVVSVAPTTLAAGNYTGRIVITSPNVLTPVTVPVTLAVTSIPKPVVVAIKNAANYFSGNVSPGENIVIGGTGIGPATLASGVVANNAFTTTVGSTRVLFDGVAAPIIYASDTQTSVMVPYGVTGRTSTSVVVEFSGVQSTPVTYNIAAAVPGIYTQNAQGTGPGVDPESERRHQQPRPARKARQRHHRLHDRRRRYQSTRHGRRDHSVRRYGPQEAPVRRNRHHRWRSRRRAVRRLRPGHRHRRHAGQSADPRHRARRRQRPHRDQRGYCQLIRSRSPHRSRPIVRKRRPLGRTIIPIVRPYSILSASTGLTDEARCAGK